MFEPPIDRNWRDRALCTAEDPELFFPVSNGSACSDQIAEAKGICARCPVRTTCLSEALSTGQDFGIWGVMTEVERRNFKRREGRRRQREDTRPIRIVEEAVA